MAARKTQHLKVSPDERSLILDLRMDGLPVWYIARRTGWSVRTVERYLEAAGLVRRQGATKAAVRRLHAQRCSARAIAERLGLSRTTVYQHLEELGLRPRQTGVRKRRRAARQRRESAVRAVVREIRERDARESGRPLAARAVELGRAALMEVLT